MERWSQAVEEYRELSVNLRHYSNMSYVNLTLALAVQAALLTTVLRDPPPPVTVHVLMGLGGMLLTALFYVNEHRMRAYWTAYFRRAAELEEKLDFASYQQAPRHSLIRSSVAIRVVYIVLFLFWAAAVFYPTIFT
jgi:hypothetical protein